MGKSPGEPENVNSFPQQIIDTDFLIALLTILPNYLRIVLKNLEALICLGVYCNIQSCVTKFITYTSNPPHYTRYTCRHQTFLTNLINININQHVLHT